MTLILEKSYENRILLRLYDRGLYNTGGITMDSIKLSHFLTIVAKDAIVKQYGQGVLAWPTNTFSMITPPVTEELSAMIKSSAMTSAPTTVGAS